MKPGDLVRVRVKESRPTFLFDCGDREWVHLNSEEVSIILDIASGGVKLKNRPKPLLEIRPDKWVLVLTSRGAGWLSTQDISDFWGCDVL